MGSELCIPDVPTAPKPWQSSAGLDPPRKNWQVSTYFAVELGGSGFGLFSISFCFLLLS